MLWRRRKPAPPLCVIPSEIDDAVPLEPPMASTNDADPIPPHEETPPTGEEWDGPLPVPPPIPGVSELKPSIPEPMVDTTVPSTPPRIHCHGPQRRRFESNPSTFQRVARQVRADAFDEVVNDTTAVCRPLPPAVLTVCGLVLTACLFYFRSSSPKDPILV